MVMMVSGGNVKPKWKIPENFENLCGGLKNHHPPLAPFGSVG